jgi:hypothetical protein
MDNVGDLALRIEHGGVEGLLVTPHKLAGTLGVGYIIVLALHLLGLASSEHLLKRRAHFLSRWPRASEGCRERHQTLLSHQRLPTHECGA